MFGSNVKHKEWLVKGNKYSDKQSSENVLCSDKIFHVQNVIKENESKTIRSHYKTDANLWLRSLDDNQTNREKTKDFWT